MPRISLWNPKKGSDYRFIDRTIGENLRISGDGVLIHMYTGPTTDSNGKSDTSITTIQDVLFLTNTNRKYSPDVIELKGHHTQQSMYDMSQFGTVMSPDIIQVEFHYNDMVDMLGRKLISGDVLEFPSMRDVPIGDNAVGINRYYVVQDALYASSGYSQTWYPHIWMVRAKVMPDAPEFKEIVDQAAYGQTDGGLGQGMGIMPEGFSEMASNCGSPGGGANPNIISTLSMFCKIIDVTDKIIAEAEQNVFFDPKFFESANLFIYTDANGYPMIGGSNWFSGDGAPPNQDPSVKPAGKLAGAGIQFPTDMQTGEYYLRIDYYPERLFQKQGSCFKLIEMNVLKHWTSYNRILDAHIDQTGTTILSDGTVMSEKQPLSQVLKQKVDLYADRKAKVTADKKEMSRIADALAEKRGH